MVHAVFFFFFFFFFFISIILFYLIEMVVIIASENGMDSKRIIPGEQCTYSQKPESP